MHIDGHGFASPARVIASPHVDRRPSGAGVRLVVIHNISLPAGHFGGTDIIRLFQGQLDCNAHPDYAALCGLRVSAHFLIRRSGELIQFASCHDRAWHSGVSSWQGWQKCNDFSIGIELEGTDQLAFEDAQYQQLNALLDAIRQLWPDVALAGHSDVAPGRKTDPGPCFDWTRVSQAGSRFRQSVMPSD